MILVVLAGGILTPLTAQVEQRRREETIRTLADIKEALIGYAIVYGRLPCPSTTTDVTQPTYGVEDASCALGASPEGFIPWKTLGVPAYDAWGSPRISTTPATSFRGHWRYRVDPSWASAFTISTATGYLDVADTDAKRLNTSAERPVAIVFSSGPNLVPDLENNPGYVAPGTPPWVGYNAGTTYGAGTTNNAFDDITIWIGRPQLIARMVAAGKLP